MPLVAVIREAVGFAFGILAFDHIAEMQAGRCSVYSPGHGWLKAWDAEGSSPRVPCVGIRMCCSSLTVFHWASLSARYFPHHSTLPLNHNCLGCVCSPANCKLCGDQLRVCLLCLVLEEPSQGLARVPPELARESSVPGCCLGPSGAGRCKAQMTWMTGMDSISETYSWWREGFGAGVRRPVL